MAVSKPERALTVEERRATWAAIFGNEDPDDRDPEVVIQENYGGNRGAYLRDMARWHGVPVGKKI
jgi:hypothetical protein